MHRDPYLAELETKERYERMLRDAKARRLAWELNVDRASPLRNGYRALVGLVRRWIDRARDWRPQTLIEQH